MLTTWEKENGYRECDCGWVGFSIPCDMCRPVRHEFSTPVGTWREVGGAVELTPEKVLKLANPFSNPLR